MDRQRKKTYCLNCQRPLTLSDNYCPSCGQENLSIRFSIYTLTYDFFSNYFSFDSRLGRSVVPFLFKPGVLTRRFISGQRVSYAHPLRLYLILSFVFFLLFSIWAGSVSQFNVNNTTPPKAQAIIDSVTLAQSANGQEYVPEMLKHDSVARGDISSFFSVMKNDKLTDEEVIDSLDLKSNNLAFGKRLVHQGRRIIRLGPENFVPFAAKNISILMFIMLPIFALILWLAFRKAEPYYIDHAIHALHLHAFVFFLNLLALGMLILFNWQLWGTAFIIYSVYAYLSMKKVYQLGYRRTLWKFLYVGFAYLLLLSVGAVIEVFISFLIF